MLLLAPLILALAGCGSIKGAVQKLFPSENKYTISFNTTTLSISEGSAAIIWVQLNDRRFTDTEIALSFTSPRGDQASDFNPVPSTVLIPAGQLSGSVNLTSIDDTVYEGTEDFVLTISSSESSVIAQPAQLTISMTDNDSVPGLSIADVSVVEAGAAVFTVTLSAPVSVDVSFTFNANSGGNATSGSDYTPITNQVATISAGLTTATFTIQTSADTLDELDETFSAVVSSPINASLLTATATGTITDDDASPSLSISDAAATEGSSLNLTITLSAMSGRDVIFTLDANGGGTATAGTDYTTVTARSVTIPAGSMTATTAVTTTADTLDELDETFDAVLSSATGATISDNTAIATITDDDMAPSLSIGDISITEGASGTFTVSLSAASGKNVTFNYATSAVTAISGTDYTAISSTTATISAGANSTTLAVTTLQDVLDEADETFQVNLSSAGNASISDSTGIGTITDDDASPTLSIGDSSGPESGTVTFTIALNTASAQDITFTLNANSGGTATSGTDYTAVSGMVLTINAGNTSTTAVVTTLTDAVEEGNETFSAVISGATNATIATATGTGTILDDDDTTAPAVTAVSINDGATYAGAPLLNVKVTVTDNHSSGSQLSVRLSLANSGTSDCQSEYANNNWLAYTDSSTPFSVAINPVDGTKTVCAWAKDSAGNVSVIASPSTGTLGVNMDTILYQLGNPPVITAFTVTRQLGGNVITAGDAMNIAWTATDTEGLHTVPISFAYTTDNETWKDLTTNNDVSNSANITWVGTAPGNATSASGTVTTWTAPTSGYFMVRARARDMAGNTSFAVTSQAMNTGSWGIYAGTTDRGVGGTGKAAVLGQNHPFGKHAVHPITKDIYAMDEFSGLRKLDIKTGIVSTFLAEGINNLGSSGTLSASSRLEMRSNSFITFDRLGYLYFVHEAAGLSSTIYQFNTTTGAYRVYLPGGTAVDNTATAATVNVGQQPIAFDEQNSMYFWATCVPNVAYEAAFASPDRIMKVTQNPDGTAGAVSVVAGNCVMGSPVSGMAATSTSMVYLYWPTRGSIAVWNNGQNIVVASDNSSSTYKITNGIVYSSNLSFNYASANAYNPINGKFYVADGDVLYELSLNLTSATGDTKTVYVGGSTTAGCHIDGIDRLSVCFAAVTPPYIDLEGHIYFSDGAYSNGASSSLVRTISPDGKVTTLLGSRSFFGNGLNKSLIRGSFAGIYYKQATAPNQAAFPEGLYFLESKGMVFGRIDPATSTASVLWGNQVPSISPPSSGDTISADKSMGWPYWGGAGMPLAFDSNGLPWMRFNHSALGRINASNQLGTYSSPVSGSSYWHNANAGSDPLDFSLGVWGGYQNFTLKNESLFLMGGYAYIPEGYDPKIRIMNFDFSTNMVSKVMGSETAFSGLAAGFAPDTAVSGVVQNTQLSRDCFNSLCTINYNAALDRLYFTEVVFSAGTVLRYITTPTNPATSTLVTELSTGLDYINFTFRPDNSQIWLITETGLYCSDISSGKSWCDGTTNHYGLGPSLGYFGQGPNQMTWKDANTLLISTYYGKILEFTLPTGP